MELEAFVYVSFQARDSQTSGHRLKEDLAASQQDADKLQGDLQQVLLQFDTHVRLDTHTYCIYF